MHHGLLHRIFAPPRHRTFHCWQLDITTKCPLACRMCIRRGLPDWAEGEMSLANFQKLVPSFEDVETVVLQGWGEPLLHPDLVPMVPVAKGVRHPPAVGFVTSGPGLHRITKNSSMPSGRCSSSGSGSVQDGPECIWYFSCCGTISATCRDSRVWPAISALGRSS